MTPSGRISVLVPVFNGERYIAEALESILAQTVSPHEVLVLDDGSIDGTATVVGGYGAPVRMVQRGHEGPSAALNAGLALAEGDLLAFLDADDLWTRRKLELQVAALEGDAKLDLVFGQVEHFHSPDLTEEERARTHCPTGSLPGFFRGAMLARRASFERVGKFDPRWMPQEFVDWYARAMDSGLRMDVLPQVLLRRRLHRSNITRSENSDRTEYARVMGAILRRRRIARSSPA
jgi:glycosyltransferase involved in cell wall biosynthesis